jgi:hypothetical protein
MTDLQQDRGPSAPCNPTPPTAAMLKWQRLTILDLLLLMLSYSVAGSLCTWNYDESVTYNAGTAWAYHTTRMELLLWIVISGNNLSSVFILTTQYVFRRRRKWLSAGEWLWLLPTALFLTVFVTSDALVLLLSSGVLVLCSGLAIVCLILRACGDWGMATCRWTDVFGSLTCLSTGVLVVHDLVVHPVII